MQPTAPQPQNGTKNGPTPLRESLAGFLFDEFVKRPYYALVGRRHRRKIDVVIEVIRSTVGLLDPKRDRVGLAAFDQRYTTFLAPTADFRRMEVALKKVRQATLDPVRSGSWLFPAIGELEDSFRAFSFENIQLGIVLSDGADTSGQSAEDAGRRSRDFMDSPLHNRRIHLIGIGSDEGLSYGDLGRYSKAGNVHLLSDLYSLNATLLPIIQVALIYAVSKAVPDEHRRTLDLSSPQAALAGERPGIDLVFLVDCSPSMRGYATSQKS
jgi:Mg-chelatase subunit ChlD